MYVYLISRTASKTFFKLSFNFVYRLKWMMGNNELLGLKRNQVYRCWHFLTYETHQIVSIFSSGRSKRCGTCIGCTAFDCQQCRFCKDMPKYGGPGKLKKSCSHRACLAMVFILIACIHCRCLKCVVCYRPRNLHQNVLHRGLLHHPAASLCQSYHSSSNRVQAAHLPHLQKQLR